MEKPLHSMDGHYNLIGISGKAGSGKDFLADLCIGYEKKPLAAPLKEICKILFGQDFSKEAIYYPTNLSGREILQRIGTNMFRDTFHKDIWIDTLFKDYRNGMKWVIPDVRFPNEVRAIEARGGIVVRIDGIYKMKPFAHEHSSEYLLDYWPFEHRLVAGDTEGFMEFVKGVTNGNSL